MILVIVAQLCTFITHRAAHINERLRRHASGTLLREHGKPQAPWKPAMRGGLRCCYEPALSLFTSPQIDLIDGKGRGVIATKQFSRGEFVVEYHGDLIEITDAKKREALYAQDPSTGCYMYYFQYLSKTYW